MAKPTAKIIKKRIPKKQDVTPETYKLGIAKLESSGLDASDLEVLGIELFDAPFTHGLHPSFKPLPALKLNYFHPRTGEVLTGWPNWPPFYRIRYLKDEQGFAQVAGKKAIRYTQEPDSGVCAFFPRSVDWPSILDDHLQPLIITEGELKASCACKAGFPTIGLGGVHNYRSSKLGLTFLDELKAINWVKRAVYVIFDSDYKSNDNVCAALNALSNELMKRGAIPYVVPLPDVLEGDSKTGLDDYIVVKGGAEFGKLIHDRAQALTLAQPLWKLNQQVLYIHNPGIVMVEETSAKLSPNAFKDHAYATLDYCENVVKPDGSISLKPTSAAGAWLKWPLRREVNGLTYAPGKPRFLNPGDPHRSAINSWSGWGAQPEKGDHTPFIKLVEHIFRRGEADSMQWFLRWCAYPLQYPGHKLFSSVVMHGRRHGTGKSLLGYTLGRIYGKNFTEIKQDDLHSQFNEWAENKQFILADDVTGGSARKDADLLKKMITQREVRVNMKYVASYVVPDCINYFFTSNQPDAFFLEDDDRRFFVHEVEVEPLPDEFYMEYGLWLDTGGAAAVFHYLLNLNLGDFNPNASAMRTFAKARMIADVKSDLGAWVAQLAQHPDSILRVGDIRIEGDLFTTKELLQLYDPDHRTGTTANGLGRELRRAGLPQALRGLPIRSDLGQNRYFVIRGSVNKYDSLTACQIHLKDRHELNIDRMTVRKKAKVAEKVAKKRK